MIFFATHLKASGITADDALLARALERRGIAACSAPWDDPQVAWGAGDAVVIRSTWNYHLRTSEFLRWIDAVAAQTTLLNPASLVRWNAHKRYLAELAAQGIPVIETLHLKQGSDLPAALVRETQWTDAVIKPAVSLSAHETHRVDLRTERGQSELRRLLTLSDVLVQPHLRELTARGELSLIFVGASYTHAVRRPSALVHGKHASSLSTPDEPPRAAVRLGERVLSVLTEPPLYARVDLAQTAKGLHLLELELIEPSLFFKHCSAAAERMAEAIASCVTRATPRQPE